jgi:arylsulfatase A-like enzyme
VAPTILGFLGIEPPRPLEGQSLCAVLEGGEPEARPHFTLGYHDHVFSRDEEYAMMSRNDGTEARLYDLREDPGMYKDVAGKLPGVVRRMFDDYVIEDAGGPLPRY